MKRPNASPETRPLTLLAIAITLVLGGCDDGLEPLPWVNRPDTVELYSLARAEFIERPSAYDFASNITGAVVIEWQRPNPAVFDVAVTEDDEGQFLLLPAGVFADFEIRPGLLADSVATFDELSRAPREGYIFEEPVPADTNVVYVVRSRQLSNGCFLYGKLEVLSLDPSGIVTIRALRNPNCSDRSLTPNTELPDDDDEDDGEDGEGDGEG